MPDENLRAAADKKSIRKPATLQAEILRMLDDPRSAAFYEGFTNSWLALRDLGGMPPDPKRFSIYYRKKPSSSDASGDPIIYPPSGE